MEARNLRKERTGVVISNKMIRPLLLLLSLKKNTLFMVSSFLKRKNTMLMTKRTIVRLAILFVSWKLVL